MIRRLRELALALAAIALLLLLLEVGARLLLDPPRYHDTPLEFDAALGFRGVPGHRVELKDAAGVFEFTLNSEGLRGAELPDAPAIAWHDHSRRAKRRAQAIDHCRKGTKRTTLYPPNAGQLPCLKALFSYGLIQFQS